MLPQAHSLWMELDPPEARDNNGESLPLISSVKGRLTCSVHPFECPLHCKPAGGHHTPFPAAAVCLLPLLSESANSAGTWVGRAAGLGGNW